MIHGTFKTMKYCILIFRTMACKLLSFKLWKQVGRTGKFNGAEQKCFQTQRFTGVTHHLSRTEAVYQH